MYSVDANDTATQLRNVPQPSVGAPCPAVFSTEGFLSLAYSLQDSLQGCDGAGGWVMDEFPEAENCALITFKRPIAHMSGPPNDEAFDGHPLAERGLRPYAAFEILSSSWIRALEQISVFECIAEGFDVALRRGSAASGLLACLQKR
jgi:hypothetical protein